MKRVILTGGSGGIGQAAAEVLAEAGWTVVAPSRAELEVCDAKAVDGFFQTESCELLVCAAGAIRDAPLSRLAEEAWDEVVAVNYEAARACALAALRKMVERGYGHIIFISSHAAFHPAVGQAAYATAKAALVGLTRSLSAEYGKHGVRVNAILPGFLETRMTEEVTSERKSIILENHHMGRFNTPQAVARFIRFLHEELPHTSGQVFQLDSRAGQF